MSERHLDPPEEAEAVFCEECSAEMENANKNYMHIRGTGIEMVCNNPDCPSKFEEGTDAHRLAVIVADQAETIERLRRKIKGMTHH